MGIDAHARNFIAYVSAKKPLGCVATIGRQSLMMRKDIARFGPYCERLLTERFKAVLVDSFDYSNYEGATHTMDLNHPFVPCKTYDTVLDCGSLEHIYNVQQALANVSALCDKGGQIIHVLPANNFCGHGFWQFSPELFFSLYSDANGYTETEVFLADLTNRHVWFQVKRPVNGERAQVVCARPLYALCRTVKSFDCSSKNVQQSDYVHIWSRELTRGEKRSGLFGLIKRIVKKSNWLYRTSLSVYQLGRDCMDEIANPKTLSSLNPHLTRRRIADLLPAHWGQD